MSTFPVAVCSLKKLNVKDFGSLAFRHFTNSMIAPSSLASDAVSVQASCGEFSFDMEYHSVGRHDVAEASEKCCKR